jgi:hypothetical protein
MESQMEKAMRERIGEKWTHRMYYGNTENGEGFVVGKPIPQEMVVDGGDDL